ncbi:MAG: DUF2892 domain-containing protein [Bdellovibrionales bacterium]|nr:DUF2892 domain-containing protein [Bdellovibrionales bacterium]
MRKNISVFEAFLRVVMGFFLLFYFFLGGPAWALLGLYPLFSGSLRFCFFKKLATG